MKANPRKAKPAPKPEAAKPGIIARVRTALADVVMPTSEQVVEAPTAQPPQRAAGTPPEAPPRQRPMMPSADTLARLTNVNPSQFDDVQRVSERDDHQAAMGIPKRPMHPTPPAFVEPPQTYGAPGPRRLCDLIKPGEGGLQHDVHTAPYVRHLHELIPPGRRS